MRDASVVIGLGGIGSDICVKAESMIPVKAPDRDRVRFVAIDTDINSLMDLRRKGFQGTIIQISDNISVGLCVENQRTEIDEWYPDNPMFNTKPMTEGAGQMRAISRLALHTAVKEGRLSPLYRLIDELRQVSKEPSVQSIRFYVISSLSGGTGSGIFLPLAMYLERYVKSLFGDFDSICKGFFILPSAMKDLTDTFLEKRSLDANSYAAIKELSAFLEQGDKQDAGHELTIELAREGEVVTAPYKSAGYEYCYLFGKVNRRKLLKSSFEEIKNAVANVVYMQVCSPIRGINNSREDNVPKFLAEQAQKLQRRNLRRFGAIGCGELVYPYKQLQDYYAMRWAIDIMSNQWQQYDRIYFEKEKEFREERKKGRKAEEVNRAKEYINAIKLADRNDIFAEEIRNSCVIEGEMAWDVYLKHVSEEIEEIIAQVRTEKERKDGNGLTREWQDIQSKYKTRKEKVKQARKIWECYEELRMYMGRYVVDNSKYIAERLFTYFPGTEHKSYEMVYWLNRGGGFLHPNGVRYFLYNLIEAIENRKDVLAGKREEAQEDVNALDDYKSKKFDKKVGEKDIPEFLNKIERGQEAIYEASCRELEMLCLDFLGNYATGLIKSYEEFYDNYSNMLQGFANEEDMIAQELERQSGISSFYVCADAKCRDVMFGKLKEKREYLCANSALSAFIFQLLQRPVKGVRAKEILPNIRQYWIDSVGEEFSELLDINIFQAMKLEEECRTGRQLGIDDMKYIIEEARQLLETPLVRYISREETKEISFCCYNSELDEQRGIYQEIVKWLKERQGISDAYYCNRYQLIFYCSTVGIEAHDILEFYHGRDKSLIDTGEAFLHYEDTVQSVVLNDDDRPVIIPHIDQKWYSFLGLPDTHKGYQSAREQVIAGMFLYAYMSKRLVKNGESYHYTNVQVSRQTFGKLLWCHQYLYKCPQLFEELLQKFKEELEQDVRTCQSVDACRVYKYMEDNESDTVYDTLVEYAESLTEREFIPSDIALLIRSVKWLVTACAYQFNERALESVVMEEMKKLKVKNRHSAEAGMAKEMARMIQDFYSEQGYEENGR